MIISYIDYIRFVIEPCELHFNENNICNHNTFWIYAFCLKSARAIGTRSEYL